MRKPLRVLFVEDSEDDALLVFHILMKSSYDPTYERVDRPEAMRSALLKNEWDIILADYLMPGFSGIAALKLLKETGLDIPFIIVSGKIGEETAVEAMKAGAHDYIMKDDLKRLIPAINRGLKEASVRKEHRQAEEALKKSEESYRTLVENLNVGVYRNTGDPQGRFIQANPAIARMFGYDSVDEFMKIKVSDLYEEPEDRKSFVDAIKQTGTIINKELHLRRKDNKSIWTSVSARAHYDNNGGIDWIDGVIEDITDRKQAERLLQESEARYRAIVEAYDGYIYICSQDYRVEFMNERLIERAGYDGTGEKCYKVLHDRDSICPWCVNDRVFKGENVRWEVLSPKDNRWLYVMNTPIYHLDGSISKQSLFLDITDRKRMEEELRQAHDNLEKLVEERTAELSEKNRQLLEEIEERKRTEKALRESEERFRRLHEASFGGIAIHDKGLILEANQGLAAMTGYELSELVGMDGLKLIDTKWRDLVMKNILSDFEKPYEVVGLRTDGSTYPLEIQGKVIPYQGRKVRVTEFRDITERKRAENRLRESEEKYRHIYENIQDIYYEVSIGGIILELSPSIENLSKYKRVELIGKSIYEIYAYREEREEFLRTIRKTGRVTDYEVKMKDEDGRLLTMSLCSLLVFDEKGIPYKIVGTIRDVTERKKAEEALRESEIKYRLIFETTAAATMIIEEDSTISLVNTEFEKLSGYSKEEMEGKRKWTEFVVQNDLAKMQEYHRLRRIDPTAAPRNYEFQFVSRDGSIRDAFLTIAVIPETKKSVASILDITKRKQAEAAARESEARLRALINNLPFEFWGMDSNLYYIMQNTISIKNYGDVVGKRIEDIKIPEEVKAKWIEQDVKVLGGKILHEEYERDVEGEKRTYENFLAPVIVDEGVIGIVGAAIDVTARKHMEDALKESEKRLSDIIDFLPDATFAIDQDKKVIAWNRAIEEMTRTKAEEILGKGDYEYALPFYGIRKPLLIDLIFKADEEVEKKYVYLQKEEDVILGEADVSLKGGNRTLWGKARPLYDSKGCIAGAIQSIRDITERRRAEKALKKRERELEVKSRNLEELNTALKVLLKQRETDKDELEERTLTNVKHLLLPYIEKLKKSHLETKDAAYISIIESNLKDIISPFSHRLSSKYMTFTPKELQVANLIKEGKTTKDISELLNASPGTIDFHRNNIRRKLNLKNKRANLRSYLMTLS